MKGRSPANALKIAGQKFGRLTAVERAGQDRYQRALWMFRCECGTAVVAAAYRVRSGHTRSCGCLKVGAITHGKSRTPTHNSWVAMKARCGDAKNKQYRFYGGRGIVVCDRWRDSFENFLADMGERPAGTTLDRINSDGNYEPGNCRWATIEEQQNNRRGSIRATLCGVTRTVTQWCNALGINRDRVYGRIRRGMAPADAIVKG